MVCHVLHHAEALAHVTLDLKVHQDGADETSTNDGHCGGHDDREIITEDDRANEEDHKALDAEDKNGSMIGVVDFFLVKIELLHDVPVKGFEGHGVGVTTQAQLLVCCNDFLEVVLVLLALNCLLCLFLQEHCGRLALEDETLILRAGAVIGEVLSLGFFGEKRLGLGLFPLCALMDTLLDALCIFFRLKVKVAVVPVEDGLCNVEEQVKRNVESNDELLAINHEE